MYVHTRTPSDFFESFSASEGEQEKKQEGAEGEDSLALLAAMMDGDKSECDTNQPAKGGHRARDVDNDSSSTCSADNVVKLKVPAANDSRVPPRTGKRKARGEDRSGGVARRKRPRKDEEEEESGAESRETPGQDGMAEMKGRQSHEDPGNKVLYKIFLLGGRDLFWDSKQMHVKQTAYKPGLGACPQERF